MARLCVALHQTVAIKQLDKHGFQGNNEFLEGVAKLSKLHHENLIDLVGYCADGDQRLLVYEFIPAGTLEDHLFGISTPSQTHSCMLIVIAMWRTFFFY
jgi:hypothetical protein